MSGSLRISIIGAGIGGLAAAALLKRAGHEVTVFEQAPRFARVGAGIQMAPNAVKVLRLLGIEERLVRSAFQSESAVSRTWDTGEVTGRLPLGREVAEKFGAPYLFLHRADLHAAIESVVPSGIVRLGMKCTGLDQDARGVTLAFENGTRAEADVVIAADGVHSLVREIIVGPERPRFTGRVAYRATYPASLLKSAVTPVRTKWWGPDRHMVIYYVTAARDEVYFVTSVPERADWITPESWSAKGDLVELKASYAGFHAEVQAVIDACPEVYKWGLFEREPLSRWSAGRVVLLGDACHPMTPYMAQGAASALEDAAVLARCFDHGKDDIGCAFALFEAVRKPRASAIQAGSSANTWLKGKTDPAWVYGYDACTAPLVPPG